MGLVIGPSKSHSSYVPPAASFNWSTAALGSTVCGGRLFCKSGTGIAWIVAPAATEVSAVWNGFTPLTPNYGEIGNKPNVSDWSSLSTALTNAGLTPSDWFVPSCTQLLSAYPCRSYWGSFSSDFYWSNSERNAYSAFLVNFADGGTNDGGKANTVFVRAFRCVTY